MFVAFELALNDAVSNPFRITPASGARTLSSRTRLVAERAFEKPKSAQQLLDVSDDRIDRPCVAQEQP